ncbi:hypothetical protein X737_08900 [Mesorhizobium sp. L48C026A00]|nr:hypothetical protein X737_08900 [Mesorhizobium sp. L48C026A00]
MRGVGRIAVGAKLEHPSSDRASLGHLLPQGEKGEPIANVSICVTMVLDAQAG